VSALSMGSELAGTMEGTGPAKHGWRSPFGSLASHGRLSFIGAVFVVEIAIFFVAMVYPISPSDQQNLLQQARDLISSTTSKGPLGLMLSIFANNVRVAFLEMIPVAGPLIFAYSIFVTGQILQAFAISSNVPAPLVGFFLFFLPFAVVELSAYAIAVSSGIMLLVAWRRKRLGSELKVFAVEALVVALVLITAAAMETVTIEDPLLGFSLWIPLLAAVVGLILFVRGRGG
jgi:uncharacterized membrane protein SpoIIM required for sporulation